MDLLFKRYADPFSLVNGYIQTGRFREFVFHFAKSQGEDDRWEFFLHKVWDKSYTDFCRALDTSQGNQRMSDEDMEATIKKSMDILGDFKPSKERR